jgi:hypothetical protein
MVDRYGSHAVLAIASVLWSIAIGGTRLALAFTFLYGARVLRGVAERPNFPAVTAGTVH